MAKKKAADEKTENAELAGRIARYFREIERYDRAVSEWYDEGTSIEKVYLDESRKESSTRKYAMLWANVETLKPAVYAKLPTVICSRRYKDRDKVARTASELIERATNTSFELYGVDETFRFVRDDRLLPGRGQAWVRYESVIEQYPDPTGTIDNETSEIVQLERLKGEKVCVDYVHWKDFGHNVGKTWRQDIWLVWRIVYKTHEEVAQRFGAEKARTLSYTEKAPGQGSGSAKDDPDNRAKIYELWDKERRCVAWLAEGTKDFLEEGDPPIDFQNFFPCPEPCYATKTSKQLIPKPDYAYYRDQAKEINDLTDKIGRMSEWLVVKGFVPNAPSSVADPIEGIIRDKTNTELFAVVDSWTEFQEKGGAAKLVDWFPLDKVMQTIQAAQAARAQLIQDVFQITGISDVFRGATDPNETLGAQELKAQTGTRRLRNTRDAISNFTREVALLVAEVISEQFSPETIAAITGYRYVPTPVIPQQTAMSPMSPMAANVMTQFPGAQMNPALQQQDQVDSNELTFGDAEIALLRDDRMRSFRIDIETDSTIQADENAEKQARMEFVGVAGQYLERTALALQQNPDIASIMSELLMFAVRGFRVGKGVEDTLERGFDQMAKNARQRAMQPPPPDPRMITAQSNAEATKGKLALQAREQQQTAQLEVRQQNIDAATERRKQDLDFRAEIRHQDADASAQARDRAAKLLSGPQT